MAYATLDDVNMHLPTDKLEMQSPTLALVGVDAVRIIRGYLANVYSAATLAGWTDPSETDSDVVGYVPQLIRAIAGRFIAAFWYRERYSEDSLDDPQYAQRKYDEAMALLMGVVNGTIILDDVAEEPETSTGLTSDDFFPNDSDAGPMFSVDDKLFSIEPGRTGLGVKVG
jgi:hypothetical protein